MPKISLLIADVDGTLVTEQKILTRRTIAAVHALGECGIAFAITSGRPPRGMSMLVAPLGLRSPMAGFNGGVISHPDLSVIETRPLAPVVTRQALEMMRSHDLDVWLYTGSDWQVTARTAPHVSRETWTVKFDPTIVARFGDDDLDQAIKIVGVSDDHDRLARCETGIAAALCAQATVKRSQDYYLDITNPAANKGAVVDTFVTTYGIPPSEIATIGDMPNDVSMFRRSGLSIAMGNASDDVKAQADFVTESHDDDGFAKAVERHLLGGHAS